MPKISQALIYGLSISIPVSAPAQLNSPNPRKLHNDPSNECKPMRVFPFDRIRSNIHCLAWQRIMLSVRPAELTLASQESFILRAFPAMPTEDREVHYHNRGMKDHLDIFMARREIELRSPTETSHLASPSAPAIQEVY